MSEALAINVGANTTLPGFRGPVRGDGTFVYVPIPERKPTRVPVPTYADLELSIDIPAEHRDTPVHLDPTFASYPCCTSYTYGDEHGVKAKPIGDLSRDDFLFFYATLSSTGTVTWMPPRWGAYLIGHFCLAEAPVVDAHETGIDPDTVERFHENAHVKREVLDARVLVRGAPDESVLYTHAVPLSDPTSGSDPGRLLTDHSTDSGRGPWWRRPLRFPQAGPLLDAVRERNG